MEFALIAKADNTEVVHQYLCRADASVTGFGWTPTSSGAALMSESEAEGIFGNLMQLISPVWVDLLREGFSRGPGRLVIGKQYFEEIAHVGIGCF